MEVSIPMGESTSTEDSPPTPEDSKDDPRSTDHLVGDEQAERNTEDEPAD